MCPTMLGLVWLVIFATMVLTIPLAPRYSTYGATLHERSNSSSTHLVRRLDPDACPGNKNHFPNFSEWERGMSQFCDNHGEQKVYWDKPLVMTLTLNGHDGKPIEWVFRIAVDNGNAPPVGGFPTTGQLKWSYYPSAKLCKEKFMGFTKDKGGGMRKVYCKWDNDKGDIRDHLMLGGRYSEKLNPKYWATVTWETRPKRGQPGVDRGW
jgi:hypothetical protein